MSENINHYNAVRIRVLGSGSLKLRFLSLSETQEQVLTSLTMQASTNIQPTILANFKQQRAALEIKTTEIDEYFDVSRVIIFVKPMFASYPQ